MTKFKYPIKDKIIKLFSEVETMTHDGVELIKVYHHPHGHGIKAYARQLSNSERQSAKALQDDSTIEFVIGKRHIAQDMYVEFKDKVYRIGPTDSFEFYDTEVKFRAQEVNLNAYDHVIHKGWYQ
jgi:hypothetical protein